MIVALDLETTGLDKEKDFIIEVALIKFDENTFEIIDEFKSLVNPGILIPELNSNITGITDEMVENSPKIEDLKDEIKNFIGDFPILGHNTYFDRNFLIENGILVDRNIVLDTFFLANFLSQDSKSLSLESLCSHYKIKLDNAHRAYFDTLSTVYLFKKLVEIFRDLDKDKKDILNYLFSNCNDLNIEFYKKYFFKDYKKITNKDFIKIQVKNLEKEEISIGEEKKQEDKFESIEKYFDKLPNVEKRKNQLDLCNKIYNNFENGIKSVIEAPTGIGKTFAYLIPSILYSKKTGEKIFIATKTKILQDQIFEKELKFLKNNLSVGFTYTKVKGKQNYISLNSFFKYVGDFDIDYEKLSFLSKISLWLTNTKFGELDELYISNNEYSFLKYVNSDNKETLSKNNKYLENEFLYKQKRQIELSNIVIINQNLLFSDLKNNFSLFDEVKNLVIDESHSVEDIATDSLKTQFSNKYFNELFAYIKNIFKKNSVEIISVEVLHEKLELCLDDFFKIFYDYIKTKTNNENYTINILVDKSFYDNLDTVEFSFLGNKIKDLFLDLKDVLDKSDLDFLREIKSINSILDLLEVFLKDSNSEKYIKISHFNKYDGLKLEYTILDIGKYLENNFWNKLKNCFLMSATLAISGDFSYYKKSLGLSDFEFYLYETDFDYKKQATLLIPNDIGNIKNNFSKVQDFLKEFFNVIPGNTLVLFTSIAAVKTTYLNLNNYVKIMGRKLIAQSVSGSKYKNLDLFLSNPNNSYILGTNSFWEGVDISGDDLKYLIIHKMPFTVPSDPIFVSRSVLFENSFNDYSLPKAVLKLKQGFGRLIRSKTDKGYVIFLDNRIYSTKWGETFFDSFPNNIDKKIINQEEIIKILKRC